MRDGDGQLVGGVELMRIARCAGNCASEEACPHALQPTETEPRTPARPSTRAIRAADLNPQALAAAPPEAEKLRALLQEHGWHRQRTAESLGISRSTLWRRMKEYGLID